MQLGPQRGKSFGYCGAMVWCPWLLQGKCKQDGKEKHIDQDMLSRKMNLRQGVPTPEPREQAWLPLSMTSNIALKMSDNSEQRGHGEMHVKDADCCHRLHHNDAGGGTCRGRGKAINRWSCPVGPCCISGLRNEIHEPLDLYSVI